MENLGGYMGKILQVDLSTEKAVPTPLNERDARRFIGGRGLGAKLLYETLQPGIDPLSPQNLLIFMTGPLTGTPVPGSKMSIVAKSPRTKLYGDGSIGGHIGVEVKLAGYDGIVMRGRARRLSYLWIDDDTVELREATQLAGRGCLETEQWLKEEVGDPSVRIITVGPAAEKLVPIACITGDYGRQAGRTGMGTVMGAKNLKAVAVRGTQDIAIADLEQFQELLDETYQIIDDHPHLAMWRNYGTGAHILMSNEWGCLPTRNFQDGVFEHAEAISGEETRKSFTVGNRGCFGCVMVCGQYTEIKTGPYAGIKVEGPEYETGVLLGSNCGISSLEAVIYGNYLCDDLGIDTISVGNMIAFAMECYERGIITKKDTGGLDLQFGNVEAFLKLIRMIGLREGIGAILGQGVLAAAQKFGGGSERFAMEANRLEWPGYLARGTPANALAFATSDRGACHQRAWTANFFFPPDCFFVEEKEKAVIQLQRTRPVFDLLGSCRFYLYMFEEVDALNHFARLLTAITGWVTTGKDLQVATDRVYVITRAFNLREGFSRAETRLPQRCYEDIIPSGPAQGQKLAKNEFEGLLSRYYEARGWDRQSGVPLSETLKALDLEDLKIVSQG